MSQNIATNAKFLNVMLVIYHNVSKFNVMLKIYMKKKSIVLKEYDKSLRKKLSQTEQFSQFT